jgi:hypothetical protein
MERWKGQAVRMEEMMTTFKTSVEVEEDYFEEANVNGKMLLLYIETIIS